MSKDFFFWFSPNFGSKTGLILSGEILLFVFIIFKFPPPPPPPFENSAYATGQQHGRVELRADYCVSNTATEFDYSGRMDRAFATEAVDAGSIPGRVKPKTIKIGIHSFPA